MKTVFNQKMRKLLSVVLSFCMLCSLFVGTNAATISETKTAISYWDGWQGNEFTDLASVQADLDGSGTTADPYIVTNADQLYAVIYYGGGDFVSVGNAGTCYKLANDLYLNEDYENYADWDNTAPANKWMANDGSVDFNGTIDGDGHTIYGYYNEGKNTALIPYYDARQDSTTIVKNLNMAYCAAVSANKFVSFIFAGTNGGGTGGNQIFINNCTVRKAEMSDLYMSAAGGAILGIAGRRAVIDSCAVTDVVFNYTPTSNGGGTDRSKEQSIGSIVGGSQSGAVNLDNYTEAEVATMATDIYITLTNSYAVNNILNNTSTGNSYLVYPIGIYQLWANCYYCAMVDNVYTDSTTIPTYQWRKNADYTYTVKLRVAAVGSTIEIPVGSENYPIKTVSANKLIGESAKVAMPTFNWGLYWSTVENGYPIPEDKRAAVLWDGWQGDEYASLAAVQADLDGSGTTADPYIVTNADQLYAVIYYGGGDFVSVGNAGICYKLANDLYLNEDYENYADWDNTAPTNKWMANDGSVDFNGTIDGDGHTIYGYYNEGKNTALIPYYDASQDSTTIVKNLNMAYCAAVSANKFVSFIFAGTSGGGKGGNQILINNCTVRKAEMSDLYMSAAGGAILGIAGRRAVIDSCAVTDVVFNYTPTSNGGGTDRSKEQSIGSIIGGSQSGVVNLDNYTEAEVTTMATDIYITLTNSYAVNNTLNNTSTGNCYLVYPIGIYQLWANCYYCAMVDNVYTDSTTIPTYQWKKNADYTYTIKLRVAAVGSTIEIPVGSENYPIKNINANDIIGESAKIAMPTFNWALYWSTVANGYPIPEDKSEGKIWDGTKVTSIDGLGMDGSGTKADPYVITNGTQLYAAIFSGGNGYYYVIGNDIVLNADYMNYKNWGTSAPANKWKSGSGTDFLGHIDGNGYTIYGFYATGPDSGLIPRINNNPFAELVTIENINISHSFMGGATVYDGFIVGAVYWGGSRSVLINGCNVRNSKIEGITDNARVGGIIGAICNSGSTKINNCSVANVEFTAAGEDTGLTGWDSMGSIVGAVYTGATTTGEFNSDGAKRAQVTNSFAVNCIRTNDGKAIYPIGVYAESTTKYFLSVGAKNVYTDADIVNDVPNVRVTDSASGTTINYGLKVASTENTSVAIDPTSADYPIKQITADSVIGVSAKTAMPDLNWCYFNTVAGSVPVWADNHTQTVIKAVEPTCTETGLTEGKKCDSCSEILVKPETVAAKDHDWSGVWTDTVSGKMLTCINCDESKFKADITVENAHLTSEEGVFAVGTVLTVTKLTEGTDFDAVNAAIPAEPKRADIYHITSSAEMNGKATLAITAPEEWNATNAVICLLTDNGNLRKMDTTFENGVATTEIAVMGVYVLIDLSNPTFVGDVDGDGRVTATDLTALRNYFLGEITAEEIGGTLDVNRDDKENAVDIVVLKKYLAGLE